MVNRLPVVGAGDTGVWGPVLNSFLLTQHNADGTHTNSTGVYNVLNYGAVADNSTDNQVAFAAAVSAIPANGGVLLIPAGLYRISGSIVIPKTKRNVIIQGSGGRSTNHGSAATVLVSTSTSTNNAGTGGRLIDGRASYGLQIRDLCLNNASTVWGGTFIDLDGFDIIANAASDTSYCTITNVMCSTTAGTTNPTIGVELTRANNCHIQDCHFINFGVGIRGGRILGDYSSGTNVSGCVFHTAGIVNPLNSWVVESCIFEGLGSGVAQGIYHESGIFATALTVRGCWFGDSASGGIQMLLCGLGINITGNTVLCTTASGGTGTGISFDDGTSGLVIQGNYIAALNYGIRSTVTIHDFELTCNFFATISTAAIDMFTGAVRYRIVNNMFASDAATHYGASTVSGDHSGV